MRNRKTGVCYVEIRAWKDDSVTDSMRPKQGEPEERIAGQFANIKRGRRIRASKIKWIESKIVANESQMVATESQIEVK